jgi:hypothetical protein
MYVCMYVCMYVGFRRSTDDDDNNDNVRAKDDSNNSLRPFPYIISTKFRILAIIFFKVSQNTRKLQHS